METPKQEIARLRRILRHWERLSPAGREWLVAKLAGAGLSNIQGDGIDRQRETP